MNSAHNLGAYLRRRRERSGLSVEAVSAGSRIVPRLDALEVDRPDLLLDLDGQTLPALGERGRVVQEVILPFEDRP